VKEAWTKNTSLLTTNDMCICFDFVTFSFAILCMGYGFDVDFGVATVFELI
jgi:hypothetical protein